MLINQATKSVNIIYVLEEATVCWVGLVFFERLETENFPVRETPRLR